MVNDMKIKTQCIVLLNENLDLTFNLTEMFSWTFFVLLFDKNRQKSTKHDKVNEKFIFLCKKNSKKVSKMDAENRVTNEGGST